MWASVDANGVVKLTARTRWRKDLVAGIDPTRFGETSFTCTSGPSIVVTPATGFKVIRVSDGATVYSFPSGAFSLAGTTVSTDTSPAQYTEVIQQLTIPLGSTAATGEVNPPLGQAHGQYEILWNDWSRIVGVQNINTTDPCGGLDSGFGGRVIVNFNGQANATPTLTSTMISQVPRGFDYVQNLNAQSPQSLALTYQTATGPSYPTFGWKTPIPGFSLDPHTGTITIPAASTSALLDNALNPTSGGDYMFHVEVTDSTGQLSTRDGLLDAITSTNHPPAISAPSDQTGVVGKAITFAVSATDVDAGQTLTLQATGLPAGASFPTTNGPNTGVSSTFTWTPSDPGTTCVNFEVTDSGTAAVSFIDKYTTQAHVCFDIQPAAKAVCPGGSVFADPNTCGAAVGCSCDVGTLQVQPIATGAGPYSFECTCATPLSTDSCTGTVTVVDNTAPALTCPAPVAVECTGNEQAATGAGVSHATDACGAVTVNDPAAGSYPLGTTTVVHTAVDGSNNVSSCTNTVTVVDTTRPALTCPAPLTAECTANGAAALTPPAAAASDVCSSVTVVGPGAGDYPLGSTTVSYSAQDQSGNTSTCTSAITVVDTTKPSLTCPAPLTVECTGNNAASVTPGSASASDACSNVLLSGPAAGSYPLGSTTVTYTAIDESANASTCTSTIGVVDTTAPVITVPANVATQYVAGNCGGPAITVPVLPTAADSCNGALAVTCTTVPANSYGANTVTCTATDASGNASTATLTLVIEQPLQVVFDPPLVGGGTVSNRFTVNQTLVHKVRLLDCAQHDVTSTAPVTVSLDVQLRNQTSTGSVEVLDVPPTFNGVGDAGSRLVLIGGDYQYNLNTSGYQSGTQASSYFYRSTVSVAYDSAPGITVGHEVAQLESK